MSERVLKVTVLGEDRGGSKALRDVGDSAGAAEGKLSGLAPKFAAAGLAASAALGAAYSQSVDISKGNEKLGAQLGLTAAESDRAGKLAGDLYKGAYGDSLGQVNDAIASVSRNISGLGTTSSADMEALTGKTLAVASAFDVDLGAATAAVGALMKNGMAKDADEAFDVVTRGFQLGVDKSGDFLETLNEYGPQFQKFGLDAAGATGLMAQGLQAGARDADTVADAIKEFAIRAVDGSKLTGEGFSAVGLNAKTMSDEIAAGGPRASAALDLTLDRLRGMKDPTAQAAAAVALFGTKAEDLGASLFALDPSEATARLGEVAGAADRVDEALGRHTGLDKLKRQFELAAAGVGGFVGPLGAALPAIGGFGAVLQSGMIGKIGPAIASLGTFAASMISTGIAGASAAIPILIAWAPVILGVAAIGAAAYLLYRNWDTVWGFIKAVAVGAFNFVRDHLGLIAGVVLLPLAPLLLLWQNWDSIWGFIKGAAVGAFNFVKDNLDKIAAVVLLPIAPMLFLLRNWDEVWGLVKGVASAAWGFLRDTIGGGIGAVVGFVAAMPGRMIGALGDIGGRLLGAGRDLIGGMLRGIEEFAGRVFDFYRGLPGRILNALGDIGGVLVGAGRRIIDGLLDGIFAGFQRVRDALSRLTSLLPDWKGPAGKDAALLYNAGQLVIGGFVGGLESQFGAVEGTLGRLTGMVGGVDVSGLPSGSSGSSGSLTGLRAGVGSSSGVTWTGDLIVQGVRDPKETAKLVLAEFQKMSDRGQRLFPAP